VLDSSHKSQAQNNGTKNIKYKVYEDKRQISEETNKKKHSEIYNMKPT
jgi:hypothetical protein